MEDFIPIFAIFAVFGTITAIVVGPTFLKSRERREMQQTLRHAIDKGQDLPPEVIEVMTRDVSKNLPSRTRDIRRGVMWMATGIGIGLFGVLNDMGSGWDRDFGDGLLGVAAIPLTIGVAFIILSFFNKNRD